MDSVFGHVLHQYTRGEGKGKQGRTLIIGLESVNKGRIILAHLG